jgi:hypothetical protein
MNVWYVEVKRARDDGSEELSKVGYLHEPTRADLDELEAEGWQIGQIGQHAQSETVFGLPGSDPVIIRAHATVVAAFLDRDMEAFLNEGKPPPSSVLQEAEAIRTAAEDAGLTNLARNLQRMIGQGKAQIAGRQRGAS